VTLNAMHFRFSAATRQNHLLLPYSWHWLLYDTGFRPPRRAHKRDKGAPAFLTT
jgi:hypothetical protein